MVSHLRAVFPRCLSAVTLGLACAAVLVPNCAAQTAHFSYASRTLGSGFDLPRGVAVSAGGAIYVADQGNSTVKKMPAGCTASTCLTTLGGGFNAPKGVAVDPGGVVYVADTNNNAVKKMAAGCASSACVTMLGAGFTLPTGIAVAKGVVYVAEGYPNNDVKKLPTGCVSSTCVTTVGGGFSGPTGVAVDASGNVFVADFPINAVKEVPAGCASSACVVSLGGGFNRPAGVAVDASGNVFVADRDNDAVKEIPSGCAGADCVTTLSAGFLSPTGIAVDNSGDIFLADTGRKAVKDIMTQAVNFFSLPVRAKSPVVSLTFTFDSAGTIQAPAVLTMGAANLDYTDAGTGTCTTNTYTYNAGDTCTVNVAFSPKYSGTRNGAAVLMNSSGAAIATAFVYGTGNAPQLVFSPPAMTAIQPLQNWHPSGMAVDYSGNTYVTLYQSNPANGTVMKIPAGCVTSSCMVAIGGGFSAPHGIAVDGSGNVYVADGFYYVKKVPPGCASSACVTSSDPLFAGPQDLTVDGSGNVYVADPGDHAVRKMPPGCTASSCVTTLSSSFSQPYGVAVDGSGNVYVADYSNSTVTMIPPGCGSSACMTTLGGGFFGPSAVAVDAARNVYVADTRNGAMKEIPAGCASSACVITLSNGLQHATSIALDPPGNIYFVPDSFGTNVNELRRISPPSLSYAATQVGSESTDSPQSVSVTNIGNAKLTFPVPASGTNPSVPNGFALDSSTTCPVLTTSSSAATLAVGQSCAYAVDFMPTSGGSYSGSLSLMDNALNAPAPAYITQKIPLSGNGYTPPSMTGPTPGSTLSGASTTFTWSPGAGVSYYQFKLGTTGAGSSNVYSGASITNTSVTVSKIPTNGAYLYARLRYEVGTTWMQVDYTYTEAGTPTPPAMTSPAPGSTLTGSAVTFKWSTGGGPVAYELKIGDTGVGSSDVYDSGAITATSATVSNIPTIGQTLYVRLLYETNGTWNSIDYTYTEF